MVNLSHHMGDSEITLLCACLAYLTLGAAQPASAEQ